MSRTGPQTGFSVGSKRTTSTVPFFLYPYILSYFLFVFHNCTTLLRYNPLGIVSWRANGSASVDVYSMQLPGTKRIPHRSVSG